MTLRGRALGGVALWGALAAGGCVTPLRLPEALHAPTVRASPLRQSASGDPWEGGRYRVAVDDFVAEALLSGPRPPPLSLTLASWRESRFTLALTEAGQQPRTASCAWRMREERTELSCTLTDGALNLEPLVTLEAAAPPGEGGVLGALVHHVGAGVRTLTVRRDAGGQPGTFVFFDGEAPVGALQLTGMRTLWWREEASAEERWALAAAAAVLGCGVYLHEAEGEERALVAPPSL